MVNANIKYNPNPNPNLNPNLNPYPTLNQKPNHYPHSGDIITGAIVARANIGSPKFYNNSLAYIYMSFGMFGRHTMYMQLGAKIYQKYIIVSLNELKDILLTSVCKYLGQGYMRKG